MLSHLTLGHTHPPPTISPLPLNRCCSIAVWSLECLPAQALCQSHPPQWPGLVLQMGLISDSQRQNAQRSSPQHSILAQLSGDSSPSLRSVAGNTHRCSQKLTVSLLYGKMHHVDGMEYIFKDLFSYSLAWCLFMYVFMYFCCVLHL